MHGRRECTDAANARTQEAVDAPAVCSASAVDVEGVNVKGAGEGGREPPAAAVDARTREAVDAPAVCSTSAVDVAAATVDARTREAVDAPAVCWHHRKRAIHAAAGGGAKPREPREK